MNKKELQETLNGWGIDPTKLVEALTANNEVDFTLPTGSFFTDSKLEEVKATVREDAKRGATESALDIKAKALKAELSIDTPSKDIKEIMTLYAKQELDKAKIEPNAKVQELEQSIKNLQQTAAEKERIAQEFEVKLKEREINDKYRSLLPTDRNPALTDDEWITRLKSKVEIVAENGVEVVKDKATGTVIKDKMEKPIEVNKAVSSIFEKEPNWKITTTTSTTNTHAPRSPSNSQRGLSNEQIMERVNSELPNGDRREKAALYNQLLLEQKA